MCYNAHRQSPADSPNTPLPYLLEWEYYDDCNTQIPADHAQCNLRMTKINVRVCLMRARLSLIDKTQSPVSPHQTRPREPRKRRVSILHHESGLQVRYPDRTPLFQMESFSLHVLKT